MSSNLQNNYTGAIHNVSKTRPCSVCGKPDQCWYVEDETVWGCYREAAPGAVERAAKDGRAYWLYFAEGSVAARDWTNVDFTNVAVTPTPEVPVVEPPARTERATLAERHAAYSALLAATTLRDEHRGMLPEDVVDRLVALGYRSSPTSGPEHAAAIKAIKAGLADSSDVGWLRLPGAVIKRWEEPVMIDGVATTERAPNKGHRLAVTPGIMIPVRDVEGRIAAMRIRRDDPSEGGKYIWWRGDEEGSKADVMAHVAIQALPEEVRTEGDDWKQTVRITEGEKKADIATLLTGILTIGLPSVGSWKLAEEPLARLRPKTVVLAFDADGRTNHNVASAWARCICHYLARGYSVRAEVWDPAEGKGIDDVWLSDPGAVQYLVGTDLLREVREWLRSSGASPDAEVEARLILDEARSRCEADRDVLLTSAVIDAIIAMEKTHNGHKWGEEFQDLAEAKKCGTRFEKAVREARKGARKAAEEKAIEARVEAAEAAGRPVFQRGDNAEIAEQLVDDLKKGAAVVYDLGDVYRYDVETSVWKAVPEHKLTQRIMGYAGAVVSSAKGGLRINSTRNALDMARAKAARPGFFDSCPRGLAFENGFLSITKDGLQLQKHDARHGVRFTYDFDYVPKRGPVAEEDRHRPGFEDHSEAETEWLSFLRSVFGRPAEGPMSIESAQAIEKDTDERIAYVQEHLGLSLVGLAPKLCGAALILDGDGANGKSTFMDVVVAAFPPETVSGVAPHDWSDSQRLALMVGKRLNVVGETPNKDLHSSQAYKAIMDGSGSLTIKNVYERPYEVRMEAGHVLLANGLFAAGDGSHGFWRRNAVIPMHQTYLPEEQDRGLATRLMAHKPIVVSWLIEGALRAVARGRIAPAPASSTEALEAWKTQSDPVRRWVLAKCEGEVRWPVLRSRESYGDAVETLFSSFSTWADANKHKAITSATFAGRLKSVIVDLAREKPEFFRPEGVAPEEVDSGIRKLMKHGLVRHETEGRRCPIVPKGVAAEYSTTQLLAGI